uniref:ANK_REP_REGION domain-containing protein n=1 Tax=Macrostomum lignano TaxID=282301 RepID=A0A1I8J237_9PLAT
MAEGGFDEARKLVELVNKGDFQQIVHLLKASKKKTVLMRLAETAQQRSAGTEKCVLYLFAQNFDPFATDRAGDTAAHLAARADNLQILVLLPFESKWLQNEQGTTPLMEAVRADSWRCAKHLLHQLRQSKYNECLSKGNSKREQLLGLKDKHGRTAFSLAKGAIANLIEREMRLVVDKYGLISGLTSEEQADRQRLEQLAQAGDFEGLLRAAKHDNCDLPDPNGFTAAMWAANNIKCSNTDLWQKLLSRADPTCASTASLSCLHVAAGSGNPDAVSVLIDAGASVNFQDIYGSTPLMAVAVEAPAQASEVGSILLRRGADWSLKNEYGRTALELTQPKADAFQLPELLAKYDGTPYFEVDCKEPSDALDPVELSIPEAETVETCCFEFVRDNYSYKDTTGSGANFSGDIFNLNLMKKNDASSVGPVSFSVAEGGAFVMPPKILLVVGLEDSGLAEFINGIANAFYRVPYSQNFRFRLAQERSEKDIMVYTLFPVNTGGADGSCRSAMDTPLTLIVAPELRNRLNPNEGDQIHKKIAELLGDGGTPAVPGITGLLHGICFVLRASQYKRNDSQITVFKEITSLFGEEIEQISLPVLTYAGGYANFAHPDLKDGNVSFRKFLKLNSGVLYSDNIDSGSSKRDSNLSLKTKLEEKMQLDAKARAWDEDEHSYLELFEAMEKTRIGVRLRSKQKAKDSPSNPRQLEVSLALLMKELTETLEKLAIFEKELELVSETAGNPGTTKFLVKKVQKSNLELPRNQFAINCKKCNMTCCILERSAHWRDQSEQDIDCTACPGGCSLSEHNRDKKYLETVEKEEYRTAETIVRRYPGKRRRKQVESRLKVDIDEHREHLSNSLVKMHQCMQDLERLAHRQYLLSTADEYVEELINKQKQEEQRDWQTRARLLRDAKKSVEEITQIRASGAAGGAIKKAAEK